MNWVGCRMIIIDRQRRAVEIKFHVKVTQLIFMAS